MSKIMSQKKVKVLHFYTNQNYWAGLILNTFNLLWAYKPTTDLLNSNYFSDCIVVFVPTWSKETTSIIRCFCPVMFLSIMASKKNAETDKRYWKIWNLGAWQHYRVISIPWLQLRMQHPKIFPLILFIALFLYNSC